MSISFTPIPDDILEESAELSDAEVGRLLRWAVNYHKTGEAPKLSGNERYFAVRVKNFIDEREAARELKSKAGKASGIQRREQNATEANTIEQTRTQSNTIEQNATEGSKSLYKDKDKDKSISNSVYISRVRAREDDGFSEFWEAYPRKSGDIQSAYYEYAAALDSGATPDELLGAVKAYPWPEEMRYIPSAEKWIKNRSWTEKPQERKQFKQTSSKKGRLSLTDTLSVLDDMRREYKEAGI